MARAAHLAAPPICHLRPQVTVKAAIDAVHVTVVDDTGDNVRRTAPKPFPASAPQPRPQLVGGEELPLF